MNSNQELESPSKQATISKQKRERAKSDTVNEMFVEENVHKMRLVEDILTTDTNNTADGNSTTTETNHIRGRKVRTLSLTVRNEFPKYCPQYYYEPFAQKDQYPAPIQKYFKRSRKGKNQSLDEAICKLKAPSGKSFAKNLDKMRALGQSQQQEIEAQLNSSRIFRSMNSPASISPSMDSPQLSYSNREDSFSPLRLSQFKNNYVQQTHPSHFSRLNCDTQSDSNGSNFDNELKSEDSRQSPTISNFHSQNLQFAAPPSPSELQGQTSYSGSFDHTYDSPRQEMYQNQVLRQHLNNSNVPLYIQHQKQQQQQQQQQLPVLQSVNLIPQNYQHAQQNTQFDARNQQMQHLPQSPQNGYMNQQSQQHLQLPLSPQNGYMNLQQQQLSLSPQNGYQNQRQQQHQLPQSPQNGYMVHSQHQHQQQQQQQQQQQSPHNGFMPQQQQQQQSPHNGFMPQQQLVQSPQPGYMNHQQYQPTQQLYQQLQQPQDQRQQAQLNHNQPYQSVTQNNPQPSCFSSYLGIEDPNPRIIITNTADTQTSRSRCNPYGQEQELHSEESQYTVSTSPSQHINNSPSNPLLNHNIPFPPQSIGSSPERDLADQQLLKITNLLVQRPHTHRPFKLSPNDQTGSSPNNISNRTNHQRNNSCNTFNEDATLLLPSQSVAANIPWPSSADLTSSPLQSNVLAERITNSPLQRPSPPISRTNTDPSHLKSLIKSLHAEKFLNADRSLQSENSISSFSTNNLIEGASLTRTNNGSMNSVLSRNFGNNPLLLTHTGSEDLQQGSWSPLNPITKMNTDPTAIANFIKGRNTGSSPTGRSLRNGAVFSNKSTVNPSQFKPQMNTFKNTLEGNMSTTHPEDGHLEVPHPPVTRMRTDPTDLRNLIRTFQKGPLQGNQENSLTSLNNITQAPPSITSLENPPLLGSMHTMQHSNNMLSHDAIYGNFNSLNPGPVTRVNTAPTHLASLIKSMHSTNSSNNSVGSIANHYQDSGFNNNNFGEPPLVSHSGNYHSNRQSQLHPITDMSPTTVESHFDNYNNGMNFSASLNQPRGQESNLESVTSLEEIPIQNPLIRMNTDPTAWATLRKPVDSMNINNINSINNQNYMTNGGFYNDNSKIQSFNGQGNVQNFNQHAPPPMITRSTTGDINIHKYRSSNVSSFDNNQNLLSGNSAQIDLLAPPLLHPQQTPSIEHTNNQSLHLLHNARNNIMNNPPNVFRMNTDPTSLRQLINENLNQKKDKQYHKPQDDFHWCASTDSTSKSNFSEDNRSTTELLHKFNNITIQSSSNTEHAPFDQVDQPPGETFLHISQQDIMLPRQNSIDTNILKQTMYELSSNIHPSYEAHYSHTSYVEAENLKAPEFLSHDNGSWALDSYSKYESMQAQLNQNQNQHENMIINHNINQTQKQSFAFHDGRNGELGNIDHFLAGRDEFWTSEAERTNLIDPDIFGP